MLFDLTRASATIPPTIGIAKQNPGYDVIGVSENNVSGKGLDGDSVHRVFVQHPKIKVVHGVEEVRCASVRVCVYTHASVCVCTGACVCERIRMHAC